MVCLTVNIALVAHIYMFIFNEEIVFWGTFIYHNFMCVCVCVYEYEYVYICTTYVRIGVELCVCVKREIHSHTHTYINIYIHMCVCVVWICVSVYMNICVYTCSYFHFYSSATNLVCQRSSLSSFMLIKVSAVPAFY